MDTGCAVNLIKQDSLNANVPVNISDRITITGITEGSIPSYGSTFLTVLDASVKFYVMPNDLRVPGDGILGGEYFFLEEVTISYSRKAIVTIRRPISPIPFLNPQMFLDRDDVEHCEVPLRTAVLNLKARSRCVVPIEIANAQCDEGYLPLIDVGEGVFLGQAAFSNENGHCYVMAYNVGYEDVDIQIAPQEIEPFDVYSVDGELESPSESDEDQEKIMKELSDPRVSKRQRVRRICEMVGVKNLNSEEGESIVRFIEKFLYLFFLPGDEFPGTNLVEHTIPTTDDVPLVTKQYRYPPIHKEQIR